MARKSSRLLTKITNAQFLIIIIISLTANCMASATALHARNKTGKDQIAHLDQRDVFINRSNRISIASFAGLQSKPRLRCGYQISTFDQRIVGGKIATVSEFPWMVSLQREKGFWFGFKAYYHSCGGSLVTQSWIITAAHCLYNKDEPLRAVAGADNMNYLYRAQLRSIKNTIIHPEFDISTYDNDIALIKVSQPFNLESKFSHIGVICLERDVQVYPYDIATICGFGSNAFHKKARSHLYKTDIAIIDVDICNSSFGNMITDNMICAGGMIANKRDACSGDSGGPLQMDVDGHITLIGVVSFGNDCAMKGFPGIYTKLDNYYDWIVGHLDEPLYD